MSLSEENKICKQGQRAAVGEGLNWLLLKLQVEEGAKSNGVWVASRSWEWQGNEFATYFFCPTLLMLGRMEQTLV